jgi:hypothetical protein
MASSLVCPLRLMASSLVCPSDGARTHTWAGAVHGVFSGVCPVPVRTLWRRCARGMLRGMSCHVKGRGLNAETFRGV